MNDASRWRLPLAQVVAPAYDAYPSVDAVLLTGSVARGCADRYSDVELLVLWSIPPSEGARLAAYERSGCTARHVYPDDEEAGDWSEEYLASGIKMDITHRTVEQTDQLLVSALRHINTDLPRQHLLSGIQHALPLAGEALIRDWQERVAHYPPALSLAMVDRYLRFGPRAWTDMLAARDDLLALQWVYGLVAENILVSLAGLNRVYYPGRKWMNELIAALPLAPEGLAARLRHVFRADARSGATELDRLVDETISLVERHLPAIDTAPIRARVDKPRPVWDGPVVPLETGS